MQFYAFECPFFLLKDILSISFLMRSKYKLMYNKPDIIHNTMILNMGVSTFNPIKYLNGEKK